MSNPALKQKHPSILFYIGSLLFGLFSGFYVILTIIFGSMGLAYILDDYLPFSANTIALNILLIAAPIATFLVIRKAWGKDMVFCTAYLIVTVSITLLIFVDIFSQLVYEVAMQYT